MHIYKNFHNSFSRTNIRHAVLILLILNACACHSQITLDFSFERGFYSSPISVVLSSSEDPNATIRYTTDNSKPTPTNGLDYTGQINISQTKSIRAYAQSTTLGTSNVITHTYIYLDEITSKAYMSNHIPNNALLDEALLSIPSISIVSNQIGIGSSVANETEVSLEMFFPNGDKGFMINCGTQTWGGSTSNPKLSYRFEFKNAFGEKKLDFDVFGTDDYETHEYKVPPRVEFDKLLLRAGSQDGLNSEFGNEEHAQFLRNRFMMDASMELGFPEAHGRYVHVYVNGAYIGQYHLMERPDASWFESYYGANKDDYEVRRGVGNYWDGYTGGAEGPAHNAMTNNIDLSSTVAITNTNQYIDLQSAANYMVMMGYVSGFDWDNNQNSLCGGHQTPGIAPYTFHLWDVDFSLGQGGRWHPFFAGDVSYFYAPFTNDGPLPPGLVGHPEFNMMMADALHCACFDDGPLTQANADSLYFERAQQIDTSIIAEAARWGNIPFTNDGNIDIPQWDQLNWQTELNYVRNTFLPQRRTNLIDHFKNNNAYPSIDGVVYSHEGGIYANGHQLTLSNPNGVGTIYYTTDESDPRSYGGGLSASAVAYTGAIPLPQGVYEVKARVKNGSTWSAMCPKKFYIGQDYKNVRINEIHYNPQDENINGTLVSGKTFEFIELKNRGMTDVDMTDVIFDKGVSLFFPDGVIIPAGGFLILADNAQNFQLKYGFAPDLIWEGKLDNGGEELRYIGPDRQTIDMVTYDDDLPWDPLPSLGEYSLGCIDIHVSNNSSVNWSEQLIHYTPGAENVFAANTIPDYSGIVINEIHYHPEDYFHVGPDTLVPSKEFEFVEIHNHSSSVIYMSGLEFVEGINYEFGDVSLAPDDFIILAEDSMWFHQRYGFAAFDKYDGKLENDSDTLVLKSLFNEVVDSVAYFTTGAWDPLPDLGEYSLALIDPNADHNAASNWSHQCVFVTPGAHNDFDSDNDGVCDSDDNDCVSIDYQDFESSAGIWQSNGLDAAYIASLESPSGNYAFRIRDNSGIASSFSSSALDLTSGNSAVIIFSFKSKNLSVGEDFFLEISTDGGVSFQIQNQWIAGTHFNNDIIYDEHISLAANSISQTTVFRFRCDASVNADEVYIDNVRIESCPTTCEPFIIQSSNASILQSESVIQYIESNGTVEANSTIDFNAGDHILMTNEFEVKLGAVFHAFIETCN